MSEDLNIVPATSNDVADLKLLVETSYGYGVDSSKAGWTTATHIFDGPRIQVSMLQSDLEDPNVTIFKCDSIIPGVDSTTCGKIACCVRTEHQGDKLHMGMICVHPSIQSRGYGRKLLDHVQNFAKTSNYTAVKISVFLQRRELLEWYERRGFKRTGEKLPLPAFEESKRRTNCELDLLVLEKEVV